MIKPFSVSPAAGSEVRFQAYISALSEEIGHADRIDPLRRYCTGLLLPGERKSIEPMAALNIERDAFHPEWNYTIAPRHTPMDCVMTAILPNRC